MAILKNTNIDDTGALILPVGTTAERPSSPQSNFIRYNTTLNTIERYNGSSWEDLFFRPVVATGGTVTDITLSGKSYRRHVYSYTGSTQTFSISNQGSFSEIIVKVWGAAGGAGTNYFSTQGGPGGYGQATVDITGISSLNVVVGQGGRTSAGERSTYGHLLNSTDGRAGGFGAACGDGGGLSGIFNGATDNQANAIFIAAGGGGSGQITDSQFESTGGCGGGPGQPGDDGYDNRDTDAHGRGAPVVYGGSTGLRFFVSPNGRAPISLATSGSALCGGHADTASNWTEGGGGGSGYWGGGSGAHENTGGYWSTAGGGCGYIDEARCSNVIAASGTYQLMSTIATSDSDYVSGIALPVNGTTGGNGRVVILYPLENPYS